MDDKRPPSSRVSSFDFIRVLATFMVVFSHVMAPIIWAPEEASPWVWQVLNVFDACIRPCVPLFVMLSGALLLRPSIQESWTMVFKKRVLKIFIPLFIWSLIYSWHTGFAEGHSFSWAETMVSFLNGPIQLHLWFLYMILGLYITLPFLRIFVRHATPNDLGLFIVTWFILRTLLYVLPNTLNVSFAYWSEGYTQYIGYFVLGYFLSLLSVSHRQRWVMVSCILFLITLSALGTAWMVSRKGEMDELFYAYLAPNTIVLSALLFLVLLSIPYEKLYFKVPVLGTMMVFFSSNSFGLYLMHMLIIQQLSWKRWGHNLTEQTVHPFIGVPLTTLVVLVLGTGVTHLIRRRPVLKYLV